LKVALRIVQTGKCGEMPEGLAKAGQDKLACGGESTVQKDRADDGFKRVREGRGAFSPARGFFGATEPQKTPHAEPMTLAGEGSSIDHFRARLCQRTFVECREL